MISKTYIQANLRNIDAAYQRSDGPRISYYLSKLAILELCGWIEMSMDDVIQRHCNRHLAELSNRKYVEREIIRKNYGFDYQNNFRSMLIRLVGLVQVERIEARADAVTHTLFESNLTSLKTLRNSLAHTYTKTLGQIDSPQVTRGRFQPLYNGLYAYDQQLRAL